MNAGLGVLHQVERQGRMYIVQNGRCVILYQSVLVRQQRESRK